jgi:hypothetical protein
MESQISGPAETGVAQRSQRGSGLLQTTLQWLALPAGNYGPVPRGLRQLGISQSMGEAWVIPVNAVIEACHSTPEFELGSAEHFAIRAAARPGSRPGSRTTTGTGGTRP